MTPKEYNAMPEGDTKLAVRLAITMGWEALQISTTQHLLVWDKHKPIEKEVDANVPWRIFDPFTDPSIPYGLIGRGVAGVRKALFSGYYAWNSADTYRAESKTHAIIQAFCAADPMGHWAHFMKGGAA